MRATSRACGGRSCGSMPATSSIASFHASRFSRSGSGSDGTLPHRRRGFRTEQPKPARRTVLLRQQPPLAYCPGPSTSRGRRSASARVGTNGSVCAESGTGPCDGAAACGRRNPGSGCSHRPHACSAAGGDPRGLTPSINHGSRTRVRVLACWWHARRQLPAWPVARPASAGAAVATLLGAALLGSRSAGAPRALAGAPGRVAA